MKKFLTVLLVIAVMFTFSFGSAFAYENSNIVADRTAAVQKITNKYNASLATINYQLAVVKATAAGSRIPANASDADWNAACDEAFEAVKAALDVKLAEAYQLLGTEEQRASETGTGILGYEFATTGIGTDGYVRIKDAIDRVDIAAATTALGNTYWDDANDKFQAIDASDASYASVLAKAIAAIKNYNLDQFSKDDKVTYNAVTKSSYEWAVAKQSDALAYLGALKDNGDVVVIGGTNVTSNVATIETIYKVVNAGTVGEAGQGRFFTGAAVTGVSTTLPAMSTLKTATTLTTDNAKIDYAKAKALAAVKAAIEEKRAADLEVENQKIFTQSVATKPNQAIIDAANKEIKAINEKYDAMVEVWEYRLTNAEYRVEKAANPLDTNEYIYAYYANARYTGKINTTDNTAIAYFASNVYNPFGIYAGGVTFDEVNAILSATQAKAIVQLIADLEDEAAALKATIAVDGSTYIDVDEALEDAIDQAYMTGAATLDKTVSDTAVHMNAHELLGYDCNEATIAGKVTIDGKKYDRLGAWDKTNYSANNKKAVKAIIKEAKAAVKAAETIADANAAFLDAYAKYDAVPTKTDQAALFAYNGSLYQKDAAAKAELRAYIDYKVSLMSDKPDTNTAAALKEYFNIDATTSYVAAADKDDFLAEVIDEASLNAAIAEVKAAVDSLKTKAELKAEGAALVKEANAVKRAVTLEQKDEVLALYDKLVDYATYCDMVNYTNPAAAAQTLVAADIAGLENLELAQLNAAKKALGDVADITLANADAVSAFVDAQDAYNDLYAYDYGDYYVEAGSPTEYDEATAYETKIWKLQVAAVESLIKALPVNATAAQVKAAQDALDELGFEGLCEVEPALLTKLSKFTQDAELATIKAVETLKITASSTAAKGSITVKWTVKGDASAVEGYEIWRSTKHSSGYKKMFTTTKTSYKNTKGLKKGTRYYYKVRAIAYDADGNKIKSDWSNKARRIAK